MAKAPSEACHHPQRRGCGIDQTRTEYCALSIHSSASAKGSMGVGRTRSEGSFRSVSGPRVHRNESVLYLPFNFWLDGMDG